MNIRLALTIAFCFAVLTSPQYVWGHGVPPQFLSDSVHINNEQFSDNTLSTGEQLTVVGEIENLSGNTIRVSSLSLNSDDKGAFDLIQPWEILNISPGTSFDVESRTTVPYSITVKALRPNTYHVHTQLDVQNIGTILGRGQTVFVDGPELNGPNASTILILLIFIPVVGGGGVGGAVLWRLRGRKRREEQKQESNSTPVARNESSPVSPPTEERMDERSSQKEPSLKESKFKD